MNSQTSRRIHYKPAESGARAVGRRIDRIKRLPLERPAMMNDRMVNRVDLVLYTIVMLHNSIRIDPVLHTFASL